MLPPIFIIGCARSGTSILGEFFENNSQCKYLFEAQIWDERSDKILYKIFWKIINSSNIFSSKALRSGHHKLRDLLGINKKYYSKGHRLTENDIVENNVKRINNILSQMGEKRLVIKNPRDSLRIPFIKKLCPNAKFLHIIRDGRDVTCSLMSGMEGILWEHPKPPGWKKWLKLKTHVKCAWLWNTTIDIINSDKEKLPNDDFVEIRYEDLVTDPENTMRMIFEKFGIPFEKPQVMLCPKIQDNMKNSYHSKISKKWTVKNHSKRIGRFKENLTPKQLSDVEKIIDKNNSKLNYV